MKQLIGRYQFNDKNFWAMFDPESAIDHFIPNAQKYREQGVVFTISDSMDHHRYLRNIEIWAEHPTESIITMLVLNQ